MSSFSQFVNEDDKPEREERDEKRDDVTAAANSLRMISGGGALQSTDNKQCALQSSDNKRPSQNNDNNIGAIVAKSKKAAASLWTLLHAKVRFLQGRRRIMASCAKLTLYFVTQNCRLGVNRCSHQGCAEAKLMYLHMKTCSAGPGVSCPTQHKGCDDARKLLAHYRRCREIRARQTGQTGQPAKVQQHVCLVCTLVARQAKGMLDRTISPRKPSSKHVISAAPQLMRPRSNSPIRSSGSGKPASTSFTLKRDVAPVPLSGSSTTPMQMPPPPPRLPQLSKGMGTQQTYVSPNIQSEIQSMDYSLSSTSSPAYDSSMLGKSLDTAGGFFRRRAESLDIRHSSSFMPEHGKLPEQHGGSPEYDSTLERELKSEEDIEDPSQFTHRRRRSASCHVLSTTSHGSPGGCDTILEEPIGEELQQILEGNL
jgi:hypothetical protein